MRAVLALTVVVFSQLSLASETLDFGWLVDHRNGVTVRGSESLGLKDLASLEQVLKAISDIENENLFHMITSDICRLDRAGNGVRCDVLIQNKYLIRYSLEEKSGRYEIRSPAVLFVTR